MRFWPIRTKAIFHLPLHRLPWNKSTEPFILSASWGSLVWIFSKPPLNLSNPHFQCHISRYRSKLKKPHQGPPAEVKFKPIWQRILAKNEVMRTKYWFSIMCKKLGETKQVQTSQVPKGRCASPQSPPPPFIRVHTLIFVKICASGEREDQCTSSGHVVLRNHDRATNQSWVHIFHSMALSTFVSILYVGWLLRFLI